MKTFTKNIDLYFNIETKSNFEKKQVLILDIQQFRKKINSYNNFLSSVHYLGTNDKSFEKSLMFIDSKMDIIFSSILLQSYITGKKSMSNLVEYLKIQNPLDFDLTTEQPFYKYKITNLLEYLFPANELTGKLNYAEELNKYRANIYQQAKLNPDITPLIYCIEDVDMFSFRLPVRLSIDN